MTKQSAKVKELRKERRKFKRKERLNLLVLTLQRPLLVSLPLFRKLRDDPKSKVERITRYLERIEDHVKFEKVKRKNPEHWQYTFKSYDGYPAVTAFSRLPCRIHKIEKEMPMQPPEDKLLYVKMVIDDVEINKVN